MYYEKSILHIETDSLTLLVIIELYNLSRILYDFFVLISKGFWYYSSLDVKFVFVVNANIPFFIESVGVVFNIIVTVK